MTNTAKQLAQAALNTLATLYTVGTGKTTILRSLDICNTASAARTVRLYLVPNGGSAGTSNAILYDYNIAARGIFGWEGEQVLAAGATIQASGSAAGLTLTASGVEVS